MSDAVIRHVVVHGRVQGVGFRAFVAHEARRLGVEGWVRNRPDGSVEAVFIGGDGAVAAMITASEQGPLGSRVSVLHQRTARDDEVKLRRPGEVFSVLPTE